MKIINSKILSLFAIAISLLFTGCSTITRGTKDVLVVESEPSNANVLLSTGQVGKTPATFQLPRKGALTVTISKEGYETSIVNVVPKVSGAGGAAMAGNVFVGGIIGAAVDTTTGSMYDLKPNPVHVVLVKLGDTSKPSSPSVSLEAALKELDALKEKGILSADEYTIRRKKIIEGN